MSEVLHLARCLDTGLVGLVHNGVVTSLPVVPKVLWSNLLHVCEEEEEEEIRGGGF